MNNCSTNHNDCGYALIIEKIKSELNDLIKQLEENGLKYTHTMNELYKYLKSNLSQTLIQEIQVMKLNGELDELIKSAVLTITNIIENRTDHILSIREFGVNCDGVCDVTDTIQKAIDYANTKDRVLHIPSGVYLISKPLVLNGCTIIGTPGNIYEGTGTVIRCLTNDFTAIKQGSVSAKDIMFNISDVIVKNADIGFEIMYASNSKFENLYAIDCNVGFKIGDIESVGCLFCKFNALYTTNCKYGAVIASKEYFNNNEFNNGFIQGNEYALKMLVAGGYGAVGNTFNNVEFKSAMGRGVELTNSINTAFNNCYFECGGNAVITTDYCTFTLSGCNFGLFKVGNTNGDVNIIYTTGGGVITILGGVIFLDSQLVDKYFYGTGNTATYQNIVELKSITKIGTASGFNFFAQPVKSVDFKQEEQVITTGTVVAKVGETVNVPFTYNAPFSTIPNVTSVTMRGASGVANGLSYVVSERTTTGGVISVSNSGTVDRSISFSIYSKVI